MLSSRPTSSVFLVLLATAATAFTGCASLRSVQRESVQPDYAASGMENAAHVIDVLVINFAPRLESKGGLTQHEYIAHWRNPHRLAHDYSARLYETTEGHIGCRIVEWHELDEWPVRADGFHHTDASWLLFWEDPERDFPDETYPWGTVYTLDCEALFERFGVVKKVKDGAVDQVWIFTGAYPGYRGYESRMAGRGAYWCNGPVIGDYDCKPFLTYQFNFERELGCMLENTGHAVEFIMKHCYGRWNHRLPVGEMNPWEQFTLFDKVKPEHAAVGTMHYAPNSTRDYEWGNKTPVKTTYVDWRDYPNLTGESVVTDCSAWGNGDMEAHHLWWFGLLPRVAGVDAHGIENDWWTYYLDPAKNDR